LAASNYPQIASDIGGRVYVVWNDMRNGNSDIYCNYSNNHGVSWQPADARLDTNTAGSSSSQNVRLACDASGHVYVVWEDYRNAKPDIYCNRSSNHGATWSTTDQRLNTNAIGTSYSYNPQISCDVAGHVYVAWNNNRTGPNYDIFFNVSNGFGVNWLANDMRLDTDTAGLSGSNSPRISSTDDGKIFVVWEEYRTNDYDIYGNVSQDYGATWQMDFRLDTDPAANMSFDPSLCSDINGAYVTWIDDRSGLFKFEIYYNSMRPAILSYMNFYAITPSYAQIFTNDYLDYFAPAVTAQNLNVDLTFYTDWSSSNSSVAAIDQTGTAHAMYPGTTQIQADFNGNIATTGLTVNSPYIAAANLASSITNSDDANQSIPIGFNFNFYGTAYTTLYVCTNGFISFGVGNSSYSNTNIPSASTPNNIIAAFWDDLHPGLGGDIYYETVGVAPYRTLIVEWRNVPHYGYGGTTSYSFEIQLDETTNDIHIVFGQMNGAYANGSSATIGIENATGSAGLKYSYNQPLSLTHKVIDILNNATGSYYFGQ
jgi:hypothetical protein